jgi:hypothetical protein
MLITRLFIENWSTGVLELWIMILGRQALGKKFLDNWSVDQRINRTVHCNVLILYVLYSLCLPSPADVAVQSQELGIITD